MNGEDILNHFYKTQRYLEAVRERRWRRLESALRWSSNWRGHQARCFDVVNADSGEVDLSRRHQDFSPRAANKARQGRAEPAC